MLISRPSNEDDLRELESFTLRKNVFLSRVLQHERIEIVKKTLSALCKNKSDKLHNLWRALEFSLRDSVLQKIKSRNNTDRYGVGLVVQYAPSITPVSSLQFALHAILHGNQIITKISERSVDFIDSLRQATIDDTFVRATLPEYCRFIIYDQRKVEITNLIQENCDLRVIWGSDKSIEEIRKTRLNAAGGDITFPDRTSILIVNADYVRSLEQNLLHKAIASIARDIYEYEHGACSSPYRILWLNSAGTNHHFLEFLKILNLKVNAKFDGTWSFAVERQVNHAKSRIENPRNMRSISGMVNFHILDDNDVSCATIGRGNIECIEISKLEDVSMYTPKNIQTCSYLGFSANHLRDIFMRGSNHKPTRIVPVGCTMVMEDSWDRYSFEEILSVKFEDY
jgi:hypothetical protein